MNERKITLRLEAGLFIEVELSRLIASLRWADLYENLDDELGILFKILDAIWQAMPGESRKALDGEVEGLVNAVDAEAVRDFMIEFGEACQEEAAKGNL